MIREELTPEERALPLEHAVDPGFLNRRAIETIIGPKAMQLVDEQTRTLPPMPDWMREVRIGHIYTNVLLKFCEVNGVKTLNEVLSVGQGRIFCSTEELPPCKNIYDLSRVITNIQLTWESEYQVILEYSTEHITSDTLRMELNRGVRLSIIAIFNRRQEDKLVFRPLMMGLPWLRTQDPEWENPIMWWGQNFFENFVEDFDEFSIVRQIKKPDSVDPMRHVSERAFKICLGQILGDRVTSDWGGEISDHFTAHLHLQGRRVSGAFVLKGPARFSPMTLNYLGKNNDQIFRLAQEPADVLIVQHCHDITPPVRATLRAFAVQPSNARRYCLIDGRDSLWLLQAYGLYERAVALSQSGPVV